MLANVTFASISLIKYAYCHIYISSRVIYHLWLPQGSSVLENNEMTLYYLPLNFFAKDCCEDGPSEGNPKGKERQTKSHFANSVASKHQRDRLSTPLFYCPRKDEQ
uniref:Uncharacterized protein n=1 Tax=Cacopsylla melanoneura TaxID=428564 RepID=A0A8D9BT11_9HEMI